MKPLISAAEARRQFDIAFQPIERRERVPTARARARVLAVEITSPLDLPPFARSLMDGYAVRAADTAGASRESPRELAVVDRVARGSQRQVTHLPLPLAFEAALSHHQDLFDQFPD